MVARNTPDSVSCCRFQLHVIGPFVPGAEAAFHSVSRISLAFSSSSFSLLRADVEPLTYGRMRDNGFVVLLSIPLDGKNLFVAYELHHFDSSPDEAGIFSLSCIFPLLRWCRGTQCMIARNSTVSVCCSRCADPFTQRITALPLLQLSSLLRCSILSPRLVVPVSRQPRPAHGSLHASVALPTVRAFLSPLQCEHRRAPAGGTVQCVAIGRTLVAAAVPLPPSSYIVRRRRRCGRSSSAHGLARTSVAARTSAAVTAATSPGAC